MTKVLPVLSALPSVVPEAVVWPELTSAMSGDVDELSGQQQRWLTVATLHVSRLYESRELSEILSPVSLALLEDVGKTIFSLELRMASYREPTGNVGRVNEELARIIGPARTQLVKKLAVERHAQFGVGERQMLEQQTKRGQIARSYERVAFQILGWWSLLTSGLHLREFITSIYESVVNIESKKGADWRTIFDSHFGKLSPEFSITAQGPDHARTFEVELFTKDGRSVTASGARKKEAHQLACHAYLMKYAPHLIVQNKRTNSSSCRGSSSALELPVHIEHMRLARTFHCADPRPFSRALTHSSWVYENLGRRRDSRAGSNEVLAHLGSLVVAAYFTRVRATMLLSKTLQPDPELGRSLSLPDEELRPLIASLRLVEAVRLGSGQRQQGVTDEMAANFVQATLAAAYVQTPHQTSFERRLPDLVRRLFVEQAGKSLLDAKTLVQRLSGELKFELEEAHTKLGPDHRARYDFTLQLVSEKETLAVQGSGNSISAAKKAASMHVLSANAFRLGGSLEGARADLARFLFRAQIEALKIERKRWHQWQARNVLGAQYVATRDWPSFVNWNKQVLNIMGEFAFDKESAVAVSQYYSEAGRTDLARPRFFRILSQVINWIIQAAADDNEDSVLESDRWIDLVCLSSAQSVWLAQHGFTDLKQVVDDWAMLKKTRVAIRTVGPKQSIRVENKDAAALLYILQNVRPDTDRDGVLTTVLSSSETGPVIRLSPVTNWKDDRTTAALIDLVSESSSGTLVQKVEQELIIKLRGSLAAPDQGLFPIALDAVRADEYDFELGRLLHDLKNEVNAARISLSRRTANRTQRREAQAAASRHLDAATSIATRLANAEMLYNVASSENCDIQLFLRDYVSGLYRSLPPTFRVVPPAGPRASVTIAENVLRGVLDNLIKNSVEAMPEGGEIHFDYTVVEGDEMVLVELSDNGPGVPDYVVESFKSGASIQSSKRHGSGLGLAGVRRVLRRVGGNLEMLETLGGASWIISLPLSKEEYADYE